MRKLVFTILVILMVTLDCTPTNEPPTAYMDTIRPVKSSFGETVSFTGHGIDPDGQVVAYRWQSSIDGDLSTLASFETSTLSAGKHTIALRVQDNQGAWSDAFVAPMKLVVLPP